MLDLLQTLWECYLIYGEHVCQVWCILEFNWWGQMSPITCCWTNLGLHLFVVIQFILLKPYLLHSNSNWLGIQHGPSPTYAELFHQVWWFVKVSKALKWVLQVLVGYFYCNSHLHQSILYSSKLLRLTFDWHKILQRSPLICQEGPCQVSQFLRIWKCLKYTPKQSWRRSSRTAAPLPLT